MGGATSILLAVGKLRDTARAQTARARAKLFRCEQPIGFAKAISQLHSQTFATFGTAGSQNGAASACF